jgi:hypothetical protein
MLVLGCALLGLGWALLQLRFPWERPEREGGGRDGDR